MQEHFEWVEMNFSFCVGQIIRSTYTINWLEMVDH